jgi:hypothetical protein
MVENIVVHLKSQEEWDELLGYWNPLGWKSQGYNEYGRNTSLYIQGDKSWKSGAVAGHNFFKNAGCKIVTLQEAYKILRINTEKLHELW